MLRCTASYPSVPNLASKLIQAKGKIQCGDQHIDRPDENDHTIIPITLSDLVLGFHRVAKSSQSNAVGVSVLMLKLVRSAEGSLTGVPPAKNKGLQFTTLNSTPRTNQMISAHDITWTSF